MSVFERVRRWLGTAPSDANDDAPVAPPRVASEPMAPPSVAAPPDPLGVIEEDVRAGREISDVALLRALSDLRFEVAAVERARAVLAKALAPATRIAVARWLDARGDDAAVGEVLTPMSDVDPSLVGESERLEAWFRLAELAERRGDVDAARAWIERVLARDVEYPRARALRARLSEAAEPPTREAAGATVMAEGTLRRGRYRVLAELGRGGAGTVFVADDTQLGRRVALKVYHRRGRIERERLLHEARTPTELDLPGVVRVFDVDPELGSIAMELTDGSVKDARGALSAARLVAWTGSLIETVGALHARGLVHRDLKPSNFLVRGERIIVTDFGLAAREGTVDRAAGEGTSGYMPPEQRRGEAAHASMDVFALGVSLAEMNGWLAVPDARLGALAARMAVEDARGRPTLSEVRAVLGALA